MKTTQTSALSSRTATIQLPVSEAHGRPVLSDFFQEIQRRFDVEKDIKNAAYSFLAQKGLLREFNNFYHSDTYRDDLVGRIETIANAIVREEVGNA